MRARRNRRGFTLVEIMIVVAIIGILIAIAVPGFIRARSQSRMKACQENLTKIDFAKNTVALERKLKPSDTIAATILWPDDGTGYLKHEPQEPSGFAYVIGIVSIDPTCTSGYAGHSLIEIGDPITTLEG